MRKVLGVVGSPRSGGNTRILVSRVPEGARAAGAAADILLLGEMSVHECDGCHACWKGRRWLVCVLSDKTVKPPSHICGSYASGISLFAELSPSCPS